MKEDLTVRVAGDLPTDLDGRYKRIYATVNAAAFSLNQVLSHYRTLRELLVEYDSESAGLEDAQSLAGGEGVACLIDLAYPKRNEIVGLAWDLVDWLDRLRKLVRIIGGVKREQQAWYRLAMRLLANVEDVRHTLQHFDERMGEFVKGTFPLHGSVTGTFAGTSAPTRGRVLLSTPARYATDRDVTIAQIELLQEVEGEVDGIIFSIADLSIDLSEVVGGLANVKAGMAASLFEKYGFRWPEE